MRRCCCCCCRRGLAECDDTRKRCCEDDDAACLRMGEERADDDDAFVGVVLRDDDEYECCDAIDRGEEAEDTAGEDSARAARVSLLRTPLRFRLAEAVCVGLLELRRRPEGRGRGPLGMGRGLLGGRGEPRDLAEEWCVTRMAGCFCT